MKAVYLIKRLQSFPHYKVTPLRGGATSQPNFTGVDLIHLAFITASSYLGQKKNMCVYVGGWGSDLCYSCWELENTFLNTFI